MSNVTIQARISPELKEQADTLFNTLGLSTSDAIRIFIQQAVNFGGLPFPITVKRPNVDTVAAMTELDEKGGNTFTSPNDLFADWKN